MVGKPVPDKSFWYISVHDAIPGDVIAYCRMMIKILIPIRLLSNENAEVMLGVAIAPSGSWDKLVKY